jgi:hypothetical protein
MLMRDPRDKKGIEHRDKELPIFKPGPSIEEFLDDALPGTQTVIAYASAEARCGSAGVYVAAAATVQIWAGRTRCFVDREDARTVKCKGNTAECCTALAIRAQRKDIHV